MSALPARAACGPTTACQLPRPCEQAAAQEEHSELEVLPSSGQLGQR